MKYNVSLLWVSHHEGGKERERRKLRRPREREKGYWVLIRYVCASGDSGQLKMFIIFGAKAVGPPS